MNTLTREQVLAMTAGVEMDRLVRGLVWGDAPPELSVVFDRESDCWAPRYIFPSYSTDIAAAWEVVEHYRTLWQTYPERPQPYEWHWEFQDFGGDGWLAEVRAEGSTQAECLALTFPLAVCRVALLLTLTEAA